jgi:Lar family restriction alleviation protein
MVPEVRTLPADDGCRGDLCCVQTGAAVSSAKPCPFCGSTRIDTKEGSTFRWRLAYCVDCEATSGEVRVTSKDSPQARDAALAEWNRRITEWEDRV